MALGREMHDRARPVAPEQRGDGAFVADVHPFETIAVHALAAAIVARFSAFPA